MNQYTVYQLKQYQIFGSGTFDMNMIHNLFSLDHWKLPLSLSENKFEFRPKAF